MGIGPDFTVFAQPVSSVFLVQNGTIFARSGFAVRGLTAVKIKMGKGTTPNQKHSLYLGSDQRKQFDGLP